MRPSTLSLASDLSNNNFFVSKFKKTKASAFSDVEATADRAHNSRSVKHTYSAYIIIVHHMARFMLPFYELILFQNA